MTISTKKITANTSYYIAALTSQKILAFSYFIIIARFLGAEDIGYYILALSFSQIMALFIDLGISSTLTRQIARDQKVISKLINSLIIYKFVIGAAVYLLLVGLAFIFHYAPLVRELIFLAGIVMFLDSLALMFYAILRGLHNLTYESLSLFIYQVTVITLGGWGLWLGFSVKVLMYSLIIASAFNVIYAILMLAKKIKFDFRLELDIALLKSILLLAWPFGLAGIFIKIQQLSDTVLLSLLSTAHEVGWYGIAHKLVFSFEFIPLSFMGAIFPAMSHFFISDQKQLIRILNLVSKYLAFIVIPLVFGGYVLAEQIILTLYGSEFIPSIANFKILLLGLPFIFLGYPLNAFLAAIDKQKVNMYLLASAAMISLVGNFYFIPKIGGVGAAISFIISLLFLFTGYLVAIYKQLTFSFREYFMQLFKIFVIGFLMALIANYLLPVMVWWLIVPVAGLFYLGLILIFKIVSLTEIRYVYKSFKQD